MNSLIITALLVTHLLCFLIGKSITENKAIDNFLKLQKKHKEDEQELKDKNTKLTDAVCRYMNKCAKYDRALSYLEDRYQRLKNEKKYF